jgi:hypothetical protein
MSEPRHTFSLFCDDIRQEAGNKLSYMGVYPGELSFPPEAVATDTPIILPQLIMAFWLVCDVDDVPQRISINITMPPGRTQVMKVELPMDRAVPSGGFPPWARKYSIGGRIPFINLAFICEGFLEVLLETERETLTAGRLRITMPGRPDTRTFDLARIYPTVSPLLSEQSSPDAPETKPHTGRRRGSTRRSGRTPGPE